MACLRNTRKKTVVSVTTWKRSQAGGREGGREGEGEGISCLGLLLLGVVPRWRSRSSILWVITTAGVTAAVVVAAV